MHESYFKTHFFAEPSIVAWPKQFVIVTAYATTGQVWELAENEKSNEKLLQEICRLRVWSHRVTGFDPATRHAEPGYAIEMSLEKGKELGRQFLQDAIYIVDADTLFCCQCNSDATPIEIGFFRERLSESEPSYISPTE